MGHRAIRAYWSESARPLESALCGPTGQVVTSKSGRICNRTVIKLYGKAPASCGPLADLVTSTTHKILITVLGPLIFASLGMAELAPGTRAPEFPKDAIWLGSPRLSSTGELKGKVVLIEFWEYTCINCIRTFPRLKELYRRYRPFGFGSEVENAIRAYKRFHLPYPVVADVKDKIWKLYDSHGWPNSSLIDQDGIIRTVHHGESGYGQIEKAIQDLLKHRNPNIDFSGLPIAPDTVLFGAQCGLQTSEIFVGYKRSSPKGIANAEGFQRERAVVYAPTNRRGPGVFFVEGWWLNRADNFESGHFYGFGRPDTSDG
ncbi:MAG: redoxin domain-containing protein [Acidimicrobiia bacterium]|nr:redoxin domain-containing protein [Acidimicrobiia bacterium]